MYVAVYVVVAAGFTSTARGADFVVDVLADEDDGVGTGGVSLRDAINAANGNAEDDTITFSVSGTITLTADLPSITSNITITGPGAASLTVDGDSTHRAFKVLGSTTTLLLSDITVANAYAKGGDGRATDAGGGGGGAGGMGAALFVNDGVVTCDTVVFESNVVLGGAGGQSTTGTNLAGGGGGGFGANAGDYNDGSSGGFLGGSGGGAGYPGGAGGEGAGGGGGYILNGTSSSAGGAGGFGGGGGGGGLGDDLDDAGNGGAGGFGGGGGGAGRNIFGITSASGGAGGSFAGDGGDPVSSSRAGYGGGGAGLGGAIFARAGKLYLRDCTFNNNSATGGSAGSGATGGEGKGGAVFVNGASVLGDNLSYSGNAASDDAATSGDDDDVYGSIGTLPVVTGITRDDATPTNASQVAFSVTFNVSVTGVGASDFAIDASGVSGASIDSVVDAGGGTTYTVTVNTGSGSGTLSIDLVDDDSIQDGSSNPLGGAGANADFTAGEAYTVDTVAPGATITPGDAGPTNADAIDFAVVFDEAVTGFTSSDVVVNHSGTASTGASVTANSSTSYTVTVSGITGDGSFTVTIPAAAVLDSAGNGNAQVGPSTAIMIDNTAPTIVSITPSATDIGDGTSVTFTIVFSSDVSGFASDDVTINDTGTAHTGVSVVSDSATQARATVSGISGNGSLTLTVRAGAVSDGAGNANAGSTTSVAVQRADAPAPEQPSSNMIDTADPNVAGEAVLDGEVVESPMLGDYGWVSFTLRVTNSGTAAAENVNIGFPDLGAEIGGFGQVGRGEDPFATPTSFVILDWSNVWSGDIAAGETLTARIFLQPAANADAQFEAVFTMGSKTTRLQLQLPEALIDGTLTPVPTCGAAACGPLGLGPMAFSLLGIMGMRIGRRRRGRQ